MGKNEFLQQWIDKGNDDLRSAEYLSTMQYPTPDEIICYLCQQASEKYLKGFLFLHDIEPPKTHNLNELSEMCRKINNNFSVLLPQMNILTDYAILPRYPNEMGITNSDMKAAINYARMVQKFTLNIFNAELKNNKTYISMKIMSFNIRCENSGDTGERSWLNRRDAVLAMFAEHQPDIAGVQEAKPGQKTFLDQGLTGYKSIGVGRDDGAGNGEFMAIYYLVNSVELDNWGTFWLSQTPNTPSKGWDADIFRTATYAKFTHAESGKKFFVVNTHLDHRGTVARTMSMELLAEKTKILNPENLPMVLMGDFNMKIDDDNFIGIKTRMGNAAADSPITDDLNSFNSWGNESKTETIDHIFYRGFTPLKFRTINRPYSGVTFISDHYPIMAEFQFL